MEKTGPWIRIQTRPPRLGGQQPRVEIIKVDDEDLSWFCNDTRGFTVPGWIPGNYKFVDFATEAEYLDFIQSGGRLQRRRKVHDNPGRPNRIR